MFEKEISKFGFNIAKRYPAERIPLNALLNDMEVPSSFKKFAEAQVDEIIDDEDLGKPKTGKIDMSSSEIQTLFREIHHAIKTSFSFSREDFLDMAGKSSKFLFNYVIRPKWTLEKFLFKGEDEISRLNFLRAERYLSDYPYYPKAVIEYMEFQKKDSIDLQSWRKLHAKMDEHLLSTLPGSAESLTKSLLELFEFATGYPKIPIDAVSLFLRDKSADEMVDRVEFAKEIKGVRFLDHHELASILLASATDVTQSVQLSHPSTTPASEPRPAVEKLADDTNDSGSDPGRIGENKGSILEAPLTPTTVDFNLPSNSVVKVEPPAKLPSVRTLLSPKDEAKIIKKMFHGSRSLYHIAIHKLDESPDWKTASRIVEGIFIENRIDPYSKFAVAFTDAINAKFHQELRSQGNS